MKQTFEKYATPISIIVAGVCIGAGIVLGKVLPGGKSAAPSAETASAATKIDRKTANTFVGDDRIVLGNPKSKNLVIEVSDPSCPYCQIAAGNTDLMEKAGTKDGYVAPVPELRKLADDGKIAFVYMFGNGHGNGELAMEALYCAYEQDKFWDVHEKLMTMEGYDLINDVVKNDRTKSATLANFVSGQIDPGFMTECLSSSRYTSRIDRDSTENKTLGFRGTPHFVVNGTVIPGAQDYAVIKKALGL